MPLEATQSGAEKEKAFPVAEKLDKSLQNSDDRDVPVNPRDAIFDQMDEMIDRQRAEEMETTVDEFNRDETVLELEPGLSSQDQMHQQAAEEGTELPDDLKSDPLADYIVMNGEAPMFKTKVDGEEQLIPLDAAKNQLQKHVAAEIRLQQAATERKNLEARAAALAENEAAFNARQQAAEASPPSVVSDVSDQDLEAEAREVVKTLFTGSETEAVEGLTELLGKTRQAPGPQVDPQEVANQAVAAARQQLEAERAQEAAAFREKDLNTGFEQFSKEYPDIVGDVNLFRYADGMTDTIEVEHPDWAPSKVMAEAGKRTRSWVESMKAPSEAERQPSDRHNRKRNLTPMPRARSGTQEAPAEAAAETPQSMMEEIRAARGQG